MPSRPCSDPNSNTEMRYRVLFEGKEIGVWKYPECSAARYLVDNGLASREDTLRTYQGDTPCMRGSVGWFAKRKVKESDGLGHGGTPRHVKWTPHPFAVSTRRGEKLPSNDEPVVTPPQA